MTDAKGPYVVWTNCGYDGWNPKSYKTLKEALKGERYSSAFVVTKVVEFEVVETEGYVTGISRDCAP